MDTDSSMVILVLERCESWRNNASRTGRLFRFEQPDSLSVIMAFKLLIPGGRCWRLSQFSRSNVTSLVRSPIYDGISLIAVPARYSSFRFDEKS